MSDYSSLTRKITSAGLDVTAAEAHGIACGMVCGEVPDLQKEWEQVLFSDLDPNNVLATECRTSLQVLLQETMVAVADQVFGLELLLPDETESLEPRAAALRDWAQGFLYGFGLAGDRPSALMSQDAGEALRDFSEISRLSLESVEDEEDAAMALAELQEYMRVAALLIHQDVLAITTGRRQL